MTRIVLHLGQTKTGSTALQEGMFAASPALRRKGVFYPRLERTRAEHHLLVPLCDDPACLPAVYVADLGGPEAAVEAAWDAWNAVCDDVLGQPPDILVLSSEFLVHHTGGAAKKRLAGILAEITPDITPVIYVRHPVDHYRARLQEWLKLESRPLPPMRLNLREAIGDTEAAFGRPPALVAFDRSVLHGADIATDFITRFLSDRLSPDDIPQREANVSLSAEALVLLAGLRAETGGTLPEARRVSRLVRPLRALDHFDPPARPLTLRPDVAEAMLRAATDHRWLAETGRLALPGLDIGRIDGADLPHWLLQTPPDQLFDHDPARLRRLRDAVLSSHGHLLQA